MDKNVRRVLSLAFLIVVPFLIYAFLQVKPLDEDEKMADSIYEKQMDAVLFSLNQYADDYMVKPFSLRELMARIKAILRRTQGANQQKPISQFETIGLMEVDFKNYEAKITNEKVKLSHREFEVLHFLWTHRQEIVSRDDLLKNIWGYDQYPTTRTIDNFILKLRQKIETSPNDPQIILTVHGMGYKMV